MLVSSRPNTWRNVLLAWGCMVLLTLLFIGSPPLIVFVGLSVASIDVGTIVQVHEQLYTCVLQALSASCRGGVCASIQCQ